MSDSIWKKEVSFKRKPKAGARRASRAVEPVADEPKQSLLKKEISFKRKPKPTRPKAPKAEKQSFLKKEISFSRKPKDRGRLARRRRPSKQSFLKKEISFSRKPKVDREIERLAQEAAQAVAGRDADDRGRAADGARGGVRRRDADLEPVVEVPVEAAPMLEPAPAFEMPSRARACSACVRARSDSRVPARRRGNGRIRARACEVPVAPDRSTSGFRPSRSPSAPAEPWLAEPELPPAAEPVVAVHPPVPAAELPELDEPAAKVPFWKKDVSLSRKPKAAKAPKARQGCKAGEGARRPGRSGRRSSRSAARRPPTTPRRSSCRRRRRRRSGSASSALPKPGRPTSRRARKQGGHKTQRLVGLKIGASQLAAARVSNNGVAELQQVAREPLAAGVVVGGELRDPEALGDALKVFFAKHKLPKKGVRLGIASNRIGVRIIDIVGVAEEKQLANAVQFRAQEALPIPLDVRSRSTKRCSLGLANALQDDLLGGLGGDAAEALPRAIGASEVAVLGVLLLGPRLVLLVVEDLKQQLVAHLGLEAVAPAPLPAPLRCRRSTSRLAGTIGPAGSSTDRWTPLPRRHLVDDHDDLEQVDAACLLVELGLHLAMHAERALRGRQNRLFQRLDQHGSVDILVFRDLVEDQAEGCTVVHEALRWNSRSQSGTRLAFWMSSMGGSYDRPSQAISTRPSLAARRVP